MALAGLSGEDDFGLVGWGGWFQCWRRENSESVDKSFLKIFFLGVV
jgi:hypothetical protein